MRHPRVPQLCRVHTHRERAREVVHASLEHPMGFLNRDRAETRTLSYACIHTHTHTVPHTHAYAYIHTHTHTPVFPLEGDHIFSGKIKTCQQLQVRELKVVEVGRCVKGVVCDSDC